MKQEDKDLLLKDLGTRLPYGVHLFVISKHHIRLLSISDIDYNGIYWINGLYDIGEVKPYLRPMSSMTEEEAKELLFVRLASKYGESCAYIKNFIKLNEVSFRKESPYEGSIAVWFSFENKILDGSQRSEYSKCEYLGQINDITLSEIDWLNANHFDYRNLIRKGLAIEVTVENNPYKV